MAPALNRVYLIISILIVATSAILCYRLVSDALANQANKYDYSELNHAVYGFLSIDEWKNRITPVVEDEINNLYLPKAKKRVLKKHIENLLSTLIDKVYENIREAEAHGLKERAAKSFIKNFVKVEDIKKGIPEYADAIMKEITKPQSQRQLKRALNKQLQQYASKTFDTQDKFAIERILFETDTDDVEAARTKIAGDIAKKHERIVKQSVLLIALVALLFAMSALSRAPLSPAQHILLVLSLVVLLIAGVSMPMIDMQATIPRMSVEVLGHPIHFLNQDLYFQSKSILDVFWVMIKHKTAQMKVVGVLLVTFSIIFPVLKIFASLGYYHDYRNARKNRLVNFLVFKAGKWSMADVMVVAIFMAYVGFNGIISTGFRDLKAAVQREDVMFLTTNATSLQPGFYIFLTYTLLALFLSGFLTRKQPGPRHASG